MNLTILFLERLNNQITKSILYLMILILIQSTTIVESKMHLNEIYSKLYQKLNGTPSYDKLIQPSTTGNEPVYVTINMGLSVTSIDEKERLININIYFRQRWIDSRLDIGLNETVSINANWESNMWMPDTFFPDATTETTYKVTVPNKMLFIGPNGSVLHSQRLSLSLNCPMDLVNFPMDSQKCRVLVESYGYTAKEVVLRWLPTKNPIQLDVVNEVGLKKASESLPQFIVTSAEAEPFCLTVASTGNFSCTRGFIHFRRQMGFYIANYYVPCTLIVCLSFLSFWLDPEAVAARASIGLLTLLFSATQSSSASSNMPKMSYTKALDIFLTTTIIFCFSAIVEFILANMWQRAHNIICQEKITLIDKSDKIKTEIANLEQTTQLDIAETLRDSAQKADNSIIKQPIRRHVDNENKKSLYNKNIIFYLYVHPNPIDRIARCCFPVAFVIFNLVYWLRFRIE